MSEDDRVAYYQKYIEKLEALLCERGREIIRLEDRVAFLEGRHDPEGKVVGIGIARGGVS